MRTQLTSAQLASLIPFFSERSGKFSNDVFLQDVLEDFIESNPDLTKCYGNFDSWRWFDCPVNAYGDDWSNHDGTVNFVAYTINSLGEPDTVDHPIGRATLDLTAMRHALLQFKAV